MDARAPLDVAMALEMLRAGNPRRCRAILRLLARRADDAAKRQLSFNVAVALFWEGAFGRAIAQARASARELGILAVALEVECLIFMSRIEEARTLFDAHAESLMVQTPAGDLCSSGRALAALLHFHEGNLEESQQRLERIAAEPEGGGPALRVAHFYLAAIAYKQDRLDEARALLATTMQGGGDLFIVKWAADTREDLFPEVARPTSRLAAKTPPNVFANLRRGFAILRFSRAAIGGPEYTFEQTMLLVLVNLVVIGLLRCVDFTRQAEFLGQQAMTLAAGVLLFTVTSYLATRHSSKGAALNVAAGFYSALPLLLVLEFVSNRMSTRWRPAVFLELVVAVWSLAIVLFLVRRFASGHALRLLATAIVFATTWAVPMYQVRAYRLWWTMPTVRYHDDDDDEDERRYSAFLYEQADRAFTAESGLARERPGTEDLYFVGFAGWGTQDVFLNEVRAAQTLFALRFDTSTRSIILANDLSTRRTLPMATTLNLRHVLKAVGERMNPDEDILFLFLTSHGSRVGLGLESLNHPILFDDETLTPRELSAMLDDTRIKWRVLVVSGCESGVFVEALRNEYTLVATASAADRKSFGCESGRNFTEYGQALFGEQLLHEWSFPKAIAQANEVIATREKERALTPSLPQVSLGSAIAGKLRSFERRFDAGD